MIANTNMPKTEYLGLTFDNLLIDIKNKIKENPKYNKFWNDFLSANAGRMTIELFCYIVEQLGIRVDLLVNEFFLDTAQQEDSIIELIKNLSYTPSLANSAQVDVRCTVPLIYTKNILMPYPFIIQANDLNGNTVNFELIKKSSEGKFEYQLDSSGTGHKTEFKVTNYNPRIDSLTFFEGLTTSQTYTAKGIENELINLNEKNIANDSLRLYKIITDQFGNITYKEGTLVPTFLDSLAQQKDTFLPFKIELQSDETYGIRFSNNTIMINSEEYSQTIGISNIQWEDKLPVENDNYIIFYRIGGGSQANISPSSINLTKSFYDSNNSSTVSMNFLNIKSGYFGTDAETLEEARINAPQSLSSVNKAVTIDDNNFLVGRLPITLKSISYGQQNKPNVYDLYKYDLLPLDIWNYIVPNITGWFSKSTFDYQNLFKFTGKETLYLNDQKTFSKGEKNILLSLGSKILDPTNVIYRKSIILGETELRKFLDFSSGTAEILNIGSNDATLVNTEGNENNFEILNLKITLNQISSSINRWINIPEIYNKGYWNASSNIPTLSSGSGIENEYYTVSNSGSTNIDGISSWSTNDVIFFNGTVWQKKTLSFLTSFFESYKYKDGTFDINSFLETDNSYFTIEVIDQKFIRITIQNTIDVDEPSYLYLNYIKPNGYYGIDSNNDSYRYLYLSGYPLMPNLFDIPYEIAVTQLKSNERDVQNITADKIENVDYKIEYSIQNEYYRITTKLIDTTSTISDFDSFYLHYKLDNRGNDLNLYCPFNIKQNSINLIQHDDFSINATVSIGDKSVVIDIINIRFYSIIKTGTITTSTNNSLTISGENFSGPVYTTYLLRITSGPLSGNYKKISSGSGNTLTFGSNWTLNPSTDLDGNTFEIITVPDGFSIQNTFNSLFSNTGNDEIIRNYLFAYYDQEIEKIVFMTRGIPFQEGKTNSTVSLRIKESDYGTSLSPSNYLGFPSGQDGMFISSDENGNGVSDKYESTFEYLVNNELSSSRMTCNTIVYKQTFFQFFDVWMTVYYLNSINPDKIEQDIITSIRNYFNLVNANYGEKIHRTEISNIAYSINGVKKVDIDFFGKDYLDKTTDQKDYIDVNFDEILIVSDEDYVENFPQTKDFQIHGIHINMIKVI